MAPTTDKMKIIRAIELFAMNGRNRTMPTRARSEAIRDKIDKNCSLNKSWSISNHVKLGPGLGIARNMKIIIAVPIISLPGNTFKFIKHALEWDYFLGVITFYLLTYFMWKNKN